VVIGVIADTKKLLSLIQLSGLRKVFKGVDAILHAGPVGDVRVIDQLKEIAPTEAVCGNAESMEVRSELYVRAVWRSRGLKIGLIHGYGQPHTLMPWMLKQFEADPVDVIVYGNNFEPKARQVGKNLFFQSGLLFRPASRGLPGKAGARQGRPALYPGKKSGRAVCSF
jgi:putative phosphoesterase